MFSMPKPGAVWNRLRPGEEQAILSTAFEEPDLAVVWGKQNAASRLTRRTAGMPDANKREDPPTLPATAEQLKKHAFDLIQTRRQQWLRQPPLPVAVVGRRQRQGHD